jgi:hypothetical protein
MGAAMKFCMGVCLMVISTSVWVFWKRPDVWNGLNFEVKSLNDKWAFNQPMVRVETKVFNWKDTLGNANPK